MALKTVNDLVTTDNLSTDFELDAVAKKIKVNVDGTTITRDAEGMLTATGGGAEVYNASGKVSAPKIFATNFLIPTNSSGAWSVDYSHVGFTQILSVQVSAQVLGTDSGDRRIPYLNVGGVSLTSCNGGMMSADSAGLLAAMTLLSGNNGYLHITVIGI